MGVFYILAHLHHFDALQTCVEHISSSIFPSLHNCRSGAILGFVCWLLAGEGRGNLPTFCPKFVTTCKITEIS